MRLAELVSETAGTELVDEDGHTEILRLAPPLTPAELRALETELPCRIPDEVHELLSFARGYENGPLEAFEFAGVPGGFGMEEILPHALAVAHDGYGNYWVVDLNPTSTTWGPILFACHDPPVIVYQSPTLEEFVREFLRLGMPPFRSEIDDVHERATMRIWDENPGAVPAPQLRNAPDLALRDFALQLSDTHLIVDLRAGETGSGFSWGRYGPRTKLARYGHELIFAYQIKTRWQRLLGR
jgi:hypothetical protein